MEKLYLNDSVPAEMGMKMIIDEDDCPNLENIPDELAQIHQWACWREERNGSKLAKVPTNPVTGLNAAITKATEGNGKTKEPHALKGLPVWPSEVMSGAAGNFAREYVKYLETPEQLLFMCYLALLGHLISDKVTLDSELKPQPRLYLALLGESASTRKSTAIKKVVELFQEVEGGDLNVINGVGSAEGLAECLKDKRKSILILDELNCLVQKCTIKNAVLLPAINTLFENNGFENATKTSRIEVVNAHLCLIGASTLETYSRMFTSTFLDIGFINRMFVVIGSSEKKFSIPMSIPEGIKKSLKTELQGVVDFAKGLCKGGLYRLPIEPEAKEIFDTWYKGLEDSVFSKRLDTYGHRLMIIMAINEKQERVTAEIVRKVVALIQYELKARRFADPIDADDRVAKIEERIRRKLANGPLTYSRLREATNARRDGHYWWDMAYKNLIKFKEIIERPGPKKNSRIVELAQPED